MRTVTVESIRAEIQAAGNLTLDPRWRELLFARVLRAIRDFKLANYGDSDVASDVAEAALEILE